GGTHVGGRWQNGLAAAQSPAALPLAPGDHSATLAEHVAEWSPACPASFGPAAPRAWPYLTLAGGSAHPFQSLATRSACRSTRSRFPPRIFRIASREWPRLSSSCVRYG